MKKPLKIALLMLAGVIYIIAGFYAYAIISTKIITYDAKKEDKNPTINLSDYVVIRTGGPNGEGVAAAMIDGKFTTDYTIRYEGDEEAMTKKMGKGAPAFAYSSVDIKILPSDHLSNGDVIKYQVILYNDCEELLNCHFEGLTGTYTVSGLDD